MIHSADDFGAIRARMKEIRQEPEPDRGRAAGLEAHYWAVPDSRQDTCPEHCAFPCGNGHARGTPAGCRMRAIQERIERDT